MDDRAFLILLGLGVAAWLLLSRARESSSARATTSPTFAAGGAPPMLGAFPTALGASMDRDGDDAPAPSPLEAVLSTIARRRESEAVADTRIAELEAQAQRARADAERARAQAAAPARAPARASFQGFDPALSAVGSP